MLYMCQYCHDNVWVRQDLPSRASAQRTLTCVVLEGGEALEHCEMAVAVSPSCARLVKRGSALRRAPRQRLAAMGSEALGQQ